MLNLYFYGLIVNTLKRNTKSIKPAGQPCVSRFSFMKPLLTVTHKIMVPASSYDVMLSSRIIITNLKIIEI